MSISAVIHRITLTKVQALLTGAALLVLTGCASQTVQTSSYLLPTSTPEQQYSNA